MNNQLALHAKTKPSSLALIDNNESLSYAELYNRVRNLAGYFSTAISNSSGIVVVNIKPMASKWVNILALRFSGFTTIAVSDLSLLEELQLNGIVAIVHEELNPKAYEFLVKNFKKIQKIQSPGNGIKIDEHLIASLSDKKLGGHIEYTSGSTGKYKAILRAGAGFQDLIDRAVAEFHMSSENIFYLGGLHPGTGVGSKVPLACLHLGATCIFDQSKDAISALLKSNADRAFMTPVMVRTLSRLKVDENAKPRAFRLYCGGGFLDSELALQVKNKFNCTIYINYAATECGVVLQTEVSTPEDAMWLSPLTNKTLSIVDNQGSEAKYECEGVLKVMLETCDPKAYINDEVASKESFQKGFFSTGDIVIRRPDGKIRVIGREKNVINLGGDKKAIEPIEQLAMSILKVSNICLFASQNDSGRSVLVSVIEGNRLPNEKSLKEFALTIGKFFSKVELHLLENFPHQTTGMIKLDRKAIKNSLNQVTLKSTLNLNFN